MEYKIEGSRRNRKFVEAILPSMLQQLKLENSRKALLIKISNDCEGEGFTIPLDFVDAYLVVVKPKKLKDIGLTLAHELEHVRQFAKGLIKACRGGHKWKGKFYSSKTPYLDQPWEIAAFAKQEIIFRKALET